MVSKRHVITDSSKVSNKLSALLSPAAEAGHIMAQFNLGLMFKHGKGVKANLVKAVELYQKGILLRILQNISTLSAPLSPAAEAGLPLAQNNLACMYLDGEGVEVNPVKAAEWYQKGMLLRILQKYQHTQCASSPAAEAENTLAQYNLGIMFKNGKGVEKNLVKAFEWMQNGELSFSKYQHAQRVSFSSC
jgi:uncharacterized protein